MDIVVDQIAGKLIEALITISRKSLLFKGSADQLKSTIEKLLPIIEEIKKSGVEVPPTRRVQLDDLSRTLKDGLELCEKVHKSARWHVYKNFMLSKKMEELTKRVSSFLNLLQAHVLADVHHMRFETAERLDGLEQRLVSMKIGGGGWIEEAVEEVRMEKEKLVEGGFGNLVGMGIALGKKEVKEMVIEREDLGVVGISGIGGSGKTTLAAEVCKDDQVLSYFNNRILFLTVSQSPNVEQLRARIWGFISGNDKMGCSDRIPQHWNPQFHGTTATRCLVVLDDVWSFSVLEQLVFEVSGYKTLVVSRFEFQTVVNASYKVELLREDESMLLFCQSAFGERTIPPLADANLVKQIVDECKGLPLALKVIGASLKDRSKMDWESAQHELSQGEPISESHEVMLDRMAISIKYLPEKVKECFLDLGSFREDREIPVEMIISMWVEIHDIDAYKAFTILRELAERNLLKLLVKRLKCYGGYVIHTTFVTQHDVMRDLALRLSNQGDINERKRLLMPNLVTELPQQWKKHAHKPFDAQIVSIHIGKMSENWLQMEFPEAEVLILNFSSYEDFFFLPPFIEKMPKLRVLIIENYSDPEVTLCNLSVCSNLTNLRSLWLTGVDISRLREFTAPLKKMQKLFLVSCVLNNDSLDQQAMDLSQMFPCLGELTFDFCESLSQLPTSICKMQSLKSLSILRCRKLLELPADIGMLSSLENLQLCHCSSVETLPRGISELAGLKCLNICQQGVTTTYVPRGVGKLVRLEKLYLGGTIVIGDLPQSLSSLQSLQYIVCDKMCSYLKEMVKSKVYVREKRFIFYNCSFVSFWEKFI